MKILLVEDEPVVLRQLSEFLRKELGHEVVEANNGKTALELFHKSRYNGVITDIRMPGLDGMELLEALRDTPEGRLCDVIIVTGHHDLKSAVQAVRAGAFDYLYKPIDLTELRIVVSRMAEQQVLVQENYEMNYDFAKHLTQATHELKKELQNLRRESARVGSSSMGIFSDSMRQVVAMAERYHQDREIPILIEGETGTGKELIAKVVHYGLDGNNSLPFVSINCSALSPTLFESEFFGYEEGSFTGASKDGKKGKLELADGGTLFLDEIGDMPLDQQPKLLRALQEKEFFRVGGLKSIKIDVRVICATNQDLEKLVEEGKFRRDLYYRLNLGRIFIPPLRERTEAIGRLAQLFLENYAEKKRKKFQGISSAALEILKGYHWPGNVRELQNAIERVVLLYDEKEITSHHLTFLNPAGMDDRPIEGTAIELGKIVLPEENLDFEELRSEIVRKTLRKFNNNKSRAAGYLGLSRATLYTLIRRSF